MDNDLRLIALDLLGALEAHDPSGVMELFAEHSEYWPGDGRCFRGKSAIRRALRPFFDGRYGEVSFPADDVLVDTEARKIAIRWICQAGVIARGSSGLLAWRTRWLHRLLGRAVYWHGIDVFWIDADGLITRQSSVAHTMMPVVGWI